MKNYQLIFSSLVLVAAIPLSFAHSKETILEKAETVKNKSVDGVKSTYRKMDDKICETVNGKMKCVTKKIKNKVKNSSDEIETSTTETINKID